MGTLSPFLFLLFLPQKKTCAFASFIFLIKKTELLEEEVKLPDIDNDDWEAEDEEGDVPMKDSQTSSRPTRPSSTSIPRGPPPPPSLRSGIQIKDSRRKSSGRRPMDVDPANTITVCPSRSLSLARDAPKTHTQTNINHRRGPALSHPKGNRVPVDNVKD